MEIKNKHRNLFKEIKKNYKNDKLVSFNKNRDEFNICIELVGMGFLEKVLYDNKEYFRPTDKEMPRKPRQKAYKKLIDKNNIYIPIYRCEKPQFGGKGRSWKIIEHKVNSNPTNFNYDENWGKYIYFLADDERWYKIPIYYSHNFVDTRDEFIQKSINNLVNSSNNEYKLK